MQRSIVRAAIHSPSTLLVLLQLVPAVFLMTMNEGTRHYADSDETRRRIECHCKETSKNSICVRSVALQGLPARVEFVGGQQVQNFTGINGTFEVATRWSIVC